MKKNGLIITVILSISLFACRGYVGPRGPAGPKGDPGLSGPRWNVTVPAPLILMIVDNSGMEVGYLVSRDEYSGSILVFDTNIEKFVYYSIYTAEPSSSNKIKWELYFMSTDCSGTPMIGNTHDPYTLFIFRGNQKVYAPKRYRDIFPDIVTVYSVMDQNHQCRPFLSGLKLNWGARVYPVEMPDYEFPLKIVRK